MSESILTTDRKYRYYYVITRFIRFWIHFWKSHSACSMSVRVSAWLCPRFFSPPPSSATANFRIVSEILVSFFWLTNRFRSAVKLQGPEKRSSAYAGKKGRKEESCKQQEVNRKNNCVVLTLFFLMFRVRLRKQQRTSRYRNQEISSRIIKLFPLVRNHYRALSKQIGAIGRYPLDKDKNFYCRKRVRQPIYAVLLTNVSQIQQCVSCN